MKLNKPGRPKLLEDKIKNDPIRVNLTKDEKKKVHAIARNEDMSDSAWVRMKINETINSPNAKVKAYRERMKK